MEWMTGGEALVKSLYREGVRVVFGVPGVQLYGVLAALREEPRIRFITTRHEQATSYMADGYARARGEIGTALVVPGPGLLNAAAGLSTAYSASSPVLMISGQIPKASIGKNVGLLHEVNDQLDAIAPITKWRQRITEVEDVPAAVREAMRQLRSGRPRPVEIELPPETLEDEGEAELVEPAKVERLVPPDADLERAVGLLVGARQPIIYAGGGVHTSDAHAELTAVAELLQAPVMTTPEGKGAIDERHELSLGALIWSGSPPRRYMLEADVVLVVGSRMAMAALRPEQQVIQIDVDPDEIGRNHSRTTALVGDAQATLERLQVALRAGGVNPVSRRDYVAQLRDEVDALEKDEPQYSIIRSLRAGAPDDTIFVAGMTQIGYHSRPFWPVYGPRTYLTSSYSGNLGYEYPTALGAKVGCPDRPVLAVVGDGGFLYNSQELATAVQHNINAVVVVFNDNAFGNVARDLDEVFGGSYGAELKNPDFVKLAEAYDVVGWRCNEPSSVGRMVAEAFQLDRPVLIEVPVPRLARPMFFPARRERKRRA